MGHGDEGKASVSSKISITPIIGVAVGSALGGSLLSGAPVTAVLQSMQGSLGVVIGYLGGQLAQTAPALANYSYLPWVGAAVVPLVTGGVADKSLIGLLAGGAIGAVVAKNYI